MYPDLQRALNSWQAALHQGERPLQPGVCVRKCAPVTPKHVWVHPGVQHQVTAFLRASEPVCLRGWCAPCRASIYAERDSMAGVSTNIMLGQLAPLGTGSFGLLLDDTRLADAIEARRPAPCRKPYNPKPQTLRRHRGAPPAPVLALQPAAWSLRAFWPAAEWHMPSDPGQLPDLLGHAGMTVVSRTCFTPRGWPACACCVRESPVPFRFKDTCSCCALQAHATVELFETHE